MGVYDQVKKQNKAATGSGYSGHLKETLDPGGLMRGAAKSSPFYDSKSKDSLNKSKKASSAENAATQKQLAKMTNSDRAYADQMRGYTSNYVKNSEGLRDEASAQSKSAAAAYTNDIQPRLKGIMEDAQKQAGMAMSLEDAGDPNNKIQKAVRELYGKQAEGVRKQSLADVGVLNALGAQATAGQMGSYGAPVTGAQTQLMNANNMSQSGQAYARAQQQMQSLREQGLDRGFTESSNQYQRGEAARDRYAGSVGNYEGGVDRDIGRQQGLRGEMSGYDSGILGANAGQSGLEHGLETGQYQRNIGQLNNYYGQQQGNIQQQMAADNAQRGVYQNALMPSGNIAGYGTSGASGANGGKGPAAAPTQQPAQQPAAQAPAQAQANPNQQQPQGGYYQNNNNPYGYYGRTA